MTNSQRELESVYELRTVLNKDENYECHVFNTKTGEEVFVVEGEGEVEDVPSDFVPGTGFWIRFDGAEDTNSLRELKYASLYLVTGHIAGPITQDGHERVEYVNFESIYGEFDVDADVTTDVASAFQHMARRGNLRRAKLFRGSLPEWVNDAPARENPFI